MATAYASHNSVWFESDGGSTTVDITKPTGLAVGDLMIFVGGGAESIGTYTKTGWTQLYDATAPNLQSTALWKIADSSDVAASSFDFGYATASAGSAQGGALFRITGDAFTGAGNLRYKTISGISNVNTSLVPFSTDTLLILGAFARGDVDSYTGYAIANNNPTWTERVDVNTSTASRDASLGVATATASAVSATGNSTITVQTAGSSYLSFLIAVQEDTDATATLDTLTVSPTLNTITPTAGVTATLDTLLVSPTLNEPTVTATSPTQWQKKSKNPADWTKQNKSL